jgi:hypothetical protein
MVVISSWPVCFAKNGLRKMTSDFKQISHRCVYPEEALALARRFELAFSFSGPCRLVGGLGAIVGTRLRIVHLGRHRLAH